MKSDYRIIKLKALQDNYIWIIHNQQYAVVVDPGVADSVQDFLSDNSLELIGVLLTHNHIDHNGGVRQLQELYPDVKVHNYLGRHLMENEVEFDYAFKFKIIATPGHVDDHLCYLFEDKHLFCGDTLFSFGCGRVFSGDFVAAYTSLEKLKSLPTNTLCYPAHEYTWNNLQFTLLTDNNSDYYADIKEQIASRLHDTGCSLPVALSDELRYNLFLRCDDLAVQNMIADKTQQGIGDGLECFVALRELRNNF